MDSSVSLEDRIWFLRVCHHVPISLYWSVKPEAWAMGISVGSREVRERKGLWQETSISYNNNNNNNNNTPYSDAPQAIIYPETDGFAVAIQDDQNQKLREALLGGKGTRWRNWLRHCATSRKVAGSIPDGVIGIFHWHTHNPSGRTMVLGSTEPLIEMSTRNISWGVQAAGA